jgi:hypothetical protein
MQHRTAEILLLGLQTFQVLYLAIHDWLPLGVLNDVAAVRSQDTRQRLITVTLIQTIPFAIGLFFTARYLHQPWPHWLHYWLWISYTVLLLGQLRAWWIPYLFIPEPDRAARYKIMFGRTHTFLPYRNGLAPNTAHILLHIATAATLITLYLAHL